MDQKAAENRLYALDGVRGIAIILVLLTHLDVSFISKYLPPVLTTMLFGSGITGVSLLFILSGFFMAALYPDPQDRVGFLQKRYTRIFPLFLSMVVVEVILRNIPSLAWYAQLLLIAVVAFMSNTIWVRGFKSLPGRLKKFTFISFLVIQVLVGGFYMFWIMRHPAAVLNQQYPAVVREGIIGLVNATLTLPLGNYIPMLDGVYWSLASEVLFYALYPFICVPVIQFVRSKSRVVKILGLIVLLSFFAGLDILSHHLLVLSLLQIPICFYFVAGMVLGYLYRHHRNIFETHSNFSAFVAFFVFLGLKTFTVTLVPDWFNPWLHMFWSVPLAFVIALSFQTASFLHRFLSSRWLVFLGTISYSMYLLQTPILHLVQHNLKVVNLASNVMTIFLSFALTIGVSAVLYRLLELPYFIGKSKSASVNNPNPIQMRVVVITVGIVYASCVFFAFQSKYSLLSATYRLSPQQLQMISLAENPVAEITITSPADNFQILAMHIRREEKFEIQKIRQNLIFRMREQDHSNWYATNTYDLSQIGDDPDFIFGFPMIKDAKNKQYTVELALSDPSSGLFVTADPSTMYGVYKLDKSQLLRHPNEILILLRSRLEHVWFEPNARLSIVLAAPLFVYFALLSIKNKNPSSK